MVISIFFVVTDLENDQWHFYDDEVGETSLTTLLGTTDIPLQILFLLIFDRSFVRHELSNTPYSAFQVHLFFSSFTLW